MGTKGSTTVNTSQQAQNIPNPYTSAAGQQALVGAQGAAQQPFWLPPAPVAPFSPFQQTAFQNIANLQGAAQPWYNTAGQFAIGSQTPITGADVSQYYNPMAANVTAQMQNIFGQQNAQNTANLVQSAGGVGADRIAVGQANMANQQGLAAGQTYSNLYQQALQAAQTQKQQQANAAYAMGNLGKGSQAANLQANQAMLGAGGMQQQLAQAQMMSPYNWLQQQFAYPFQSNQYLAGIAGGVGGVMGGQTTSQGTQVSTPPQPSPISQLLGLGIAGMGGIQQLGASNLYGSAMGNLTGGQYAAPTWGMGSVPGSTGTTYIGGNQYPIFAHGGGVGYAGGGGSKPVFLPSKYTPISSIPTAPGDTPSSSSQASVPQSPTINAPTPSSTSDYFGGAANAAQGYAGMGPWSVGSSWHMPTMPAPGPVPATKHGFGRFQGLEPPQIDAYGTQAYAPQLYENEYMPWLTGFKGAHSGGRVGYAPGGGTGEFPSLPDMGGLVSPDQASSFLSQGLPTRLSDFESPLLTGLTTGHWGLPDTSPISIASKRFAAGGGSLGQDPFGGVDNLVPDMPLSPSAQGEFPTIQPMTSPQQQSSGSGKGSGAGQVAQMAMQFLPMLMAAAGGGRVLPFPVSSEVSSKRIADFENWKNHVSNKYGPQTLDTHLRSLPIAPITAPWDEKEAFGGGVTMPGHFQAGGGDDYPGLIDPNVSLSDVAPTFPQAVGRGIAHGWNTLMSSPPVGRTTPPQVDPSALTSLYGLNMREPQVADSGTTHGAENWRNIETQLPPRPAYPPPTPETGITPIEAQMPSAPSYPPSLSSDLAAAAPGTPLPRPRPPIPGGPSPDFPATAFEQPDTGRAGNLLGPKPVATQALTAAQAPPNRPIMGDIIPPPRQGPQIPRGFAPAVGTAQAQMPQSRASAQQDILYYANQFGIPPAIAMGLAKQESGFNQRSVSPAGAVGVAQLMPGTARELGVNPYDQSQNIYGGMKYLRQQYDRFGNWPQALAAYNAGPNRVASGAPLPRETQNYVPSVMANARAYSNLDPDTAASYAQDRPGGGGYGGQQPSLYGMPQTSMPQSALPYPGAPYSGPFAGQPNLGHSLITLGASIAGQGTPWAGVNIGRGLLEAQKAGREEFNTNTEAQKLGLEIQKHIDQYTRLTPNEQMQHWQMNYDPTTRQPYWTHPTFGTHAAPMPGRGQEPQLGGYDAAPGVAAGAAQAAAGAGPPPVGGGGTSATFTPPNDNMISQYAGQSYDMKTGNLMPDVRMNNQNIEKAITSSADAARGTDVMLQDIQHNADVANSALADATGMGKFLMGPGTGAEYRQAIARAIQTYGPEQAAKMLGIDPNAIGAITSMSKDTVRLGQQMTRLLGAREAAQIVNQSIAANPNWEQTQEGRIRVVASMQQALQREKDYQNFVRQWRARTPNLNGVQEAFDQANPADRYLQRANQLAGYEIKTDSLPPALRKQIWAMPKEQQVGIYDYLNKYRNDPQAVAAFDKKFPGLSGAILGGGQ